MEINEGKWDRLIRIVLGLAIMIAVLPYSAWGYIGLVPLITGIVGLCPLYQIFGIQTCSRIRK